MSECQWLYLVVAVVCTIIIFVVAAYRRTIRYLEERNRFLNSRVIYFSELLMSSRYDDKVYRGDIKNGGSSTIKVDEVDEGKGDEGKGDEINS